jgi:hypothetical protein
MLDAASFIDGVLKLHAARREAGVVDAAPDKAEQDR